jgi:Tfp pilus assembly protein PilP
MKPTVSILVCVLAAGLASAQSPSIIQNTRNTMNGVRDNSAAASSAALGMQPQAVVSTSRAAVTSATPVVSVKHRSTGTTKPVKTSHMEAEHKNAAPQATAVKVKTEAPVTATVAASSDTAVPEDQTAPDKKYSPNGKRDPFLSPVVTNVGNSGCSTGKKCLEIGTINLRGVVRSDAGFIAVVSNGLNKAYFLKENDPVFNGYVVKITGDSIVFQETLQDHLGKTYTREVVKKITTPVV